MNRVPVLIFALLICFAIQLHAEQRKPMWQYTDEILFYDAAHAFEADGFRAQETHEGFDIGDNRSEQKKADAYAKEIAIAGQWKFNLFVDGDVFDAMQRCFSYIRKITLKGVGAVNQYYFLSQEKEENIITIMLLPRVIVAPEEYQERDRKTIYNVVQVRSFKCRFNILSRKIIDAEELIQ